MYLDPGSGSIILQAIIAAVLGVGVLTKIYWKKITSLFKKNKTEEVAEEELEVEVEDQK